MTFKQYHNIHEFYDVTYDTLMRHEAQNLIPLGNLIIGNKGVDKMEWRDPANWFMATVSDGDALLLTAIMTPPWSLTLYATDNAYSDAVLGCLIDGLLAHNIEVNAVMTEKSLAQDFDALFVQKTGKTSSIAENLRIYELTEVNPDIPTPGTLRLVQQKDIAYLAYWKEMFLQDCFDTPVAISSDIAKYQYIIDKQNTYVLEVNGVPVSCANINRTMQTCAGVAFVYTPPFFRGNGYASSCVAQLSAFILTKEFTKCVLYTDLTNPTSNSIYQKIGYKPIADALQIDFK